MPVKCTVFFKEMGFGDNNNAADLVFFWRDTENNDVLFTAVAHVDVPVTIKNTDEVKSYALQKVKDHLKAADAAEYE
jgi:hypothetical protein